MGSLQGFSKQSREKLAKILRAFPETISISEAAQVLDISNKAMAHTLTRWQKQGWLSRIRRGLYLPVTLDAINSDVGIDDPWLIAEKIFAPCYIGGWSASEHWDFTEQVFQATVVMTTLKTREHKPTYKGTTFIIHTISKKHLFGTKPVWRGRVKVLVSDPTRTIVDLFNDPSLAGGIRSLSDMYREYLKSSHRNMKLLLAYAEKLGNATIFKRMGFLTEGLAQEEKDFLVACKERLSSGNSKLDPTLKSKRLITRWRLWVPPDWKVSLQHD